MPTPERIVGAPWWLNEAVDVLHRCFPREWDLLTEGQQVRFLQQMGSYVTKRSIRPSVQAEFTKEIRLAACKAAREIFGRML